MRYPLLIEGKDGWTEWLAPHRTDFKLACCSCDLVHRMQFRTVQGQIQFRLTRDMRATAAKRRKRKKQGSWVS